MARDYVRIDTSANFAVHAPLLRQYVTTLRQAQDMGRRVRDIMDHNKDGVVWTDLEEIFGLPTGSGENVYQLVNKSLEAMDGLNLNNRAREITERVG